MDNAQLAKFVVDSLAESQRRQTEHFDGKFKDLEDKVNPMHEYFVTAKTNVTVFKWAVAVGGSIVLIWGGIKEYLR